MIHTNTIVRKAFTAFVLWVCMALAACDEPQISTQPSRPEWALPTMKWYGGVDGGNWFELTQVSDSLYLLTSYFDDASVNWTRRFRSSHGKIDLQKEFVFVYPTDFTACSIEQNGRKFTLTPEIDLPQ